MQPGETAILTALSRQDRARRRSYSRIRSEHLGIRAAVMRSWNATRARECNLTALSRQDHSVAPMKSKRSVLEVLFPAVRAEIFRLLFASPTTEFYVRQLRLKTHLALHTVQDELRKLSALGLVTSRSNGFHRFYQADRKHPLYRHIHAIVEVSEKSPRTRHTALLRPPGGRASRKKQRPKLAHLRPEYPINWGTLQRRS